MSVLLVISYTCELDPTTPARVAARALFIHSFLGLGTMCFDISFSRHYMNVSRTTKIFDSFSIMRTRTTQTLRSYTPTPLNKPYLVASNGVLLTLVIALYSILPCMLPTYHLLPGHSISQTRLLSASFARHYRTSSLLRQTTIPKTLRLGNGRGHGRGPFRRGAAIAARTHTTPATSSSPVLGSLKSTNDPEIIPSSTQSTTLSNVRFEDFVACGRLSSDLLERLLPFDYCTRVQAATFDTILDGNDV